MTSKKTEVDTDLLEVISLRLCFLTGSFMDNPIEDRLYGPDRLSFELAKRIKRNNPLWDVNIIALSNLSGQCYIEGVMINRISYREPFPRKLLWVIRSLIKMKPEIIHSCGYYQMGLITLILGIIFRTKKFLTIDEFQDNVYSNLAFLSSKLNGILVQTNYAKRLLVKQGVRLDKIKIVRFGVEDLFLNQKECPEVRALGEKVILFYGDARDDRGFGAIAKAIPRVLSGSNAVFLLCIRDVYPEYVDILNKLKTYDRVFIWRIAEYPCNIGSIIRSADLVVLPFKRNTCEPPLSIVETKAVGVTLITTNVGGIKEVVDLSTDTIIEPSNLASLSDNILKALNSPLSKGKVHIFSSWDQTVEKVKEIYEQNA